MKIIKEVKYKVVFPSGRVIDGISDCIPAKTNIPFQIFSDKSRDESWIINPMMAESIEVIIAYEG